MPTTVRRCPMCATASDEAKAVAFDDVTAANKVLLAKVEKLEALIAAKNERLAEANTEVEMLIPKGIHASAGQCIEPDMLMGDDGGHQYCELRFEIDKLKYDLNEEWNEKVTQANRANEYATLLGKANFEIKELRDFVKSCIGPCQRNDGIQCRGHQLKFPPSQYCRPCRARYLLEGK